MTTYADRCYAAWHDKGLIILDIGDITNLTIVGEVNWSDGRPNFPSLPGRTHSFGIVVPKHGGRAETVVAPDELGQCPFGFLHFIHYPKHAAYQVPPVRSDSPGGSGHADDVFVMDNGLVFGSSSDAGAGGLWAVRCRPGFRGTVAWNGDESDVIVTRDRRGSRG